MARQEEGGCLWMGEATRVMNCTYTQMSTSKTGEDLWIISLSTSRLWYYTIVLQNVLITGNYAKGTRVFCVLFLTTACKCTIISTTISTGKKKSLIPSMQVKSGTTFFHWNREWWTHPFWRTFGNAIKNEKHIHTLWSTNSIFRVLTVLNNLWGIKHLITKAFYFSSVFL